MIGTLSCYCNRDSNPLTESSAKFSTTTILVYSVHVSVFNMFQFCGNMLCIYIDHLMVLLSLSSTIAMADIRLIKNYCYNI